jgi:hypothetical protein
VESDAARVCRRISLHHRLDGARVGANDLLMGTMTEDTIRSDTSGRGPARAIECSRNGGEELPGAGDRWLIRHARLLLAGAGRSGIRACISPGLFYAVRWVDGS